MRTRLASSLAIAALGLMAQVSFAVEVGDTRADILAHYGQPHLGDDKRGIAIYTWDIWRMQIDYRNGIAAKISFTKDDPLTQSDIQQLLSQDGGAAAWTLVPGNSRGPASWTRSDGATAKLDAAGYTLQFEGTHKYQPPAPSTSVVAGSTPPPAPVASASASASPAIAATPGEKAPSAVPDNTPVAIIEPDEKSASPANDDSPPVLKSSSVPEAAASPSATPTAVKGAMPYVLGATGVLALAIGAVFFKTLAGAKKTAGKGSGGQQATSTGPASFGTVNRSQFELVIAEMYRRQGYDVELSSGATADGDLAIRLRQDGLLTIIGCRLAGDVMMLEDLRCFCELLAAAGASRGIFVTTGSYSVEAKAFAIGKPLELLSIPEIEGLARAVAEDGENIWEIGPWLGEFLSEVKISEPDCPVCGRPMKLRRPNPGVPFWTCKTFPTCHGVRNARIEVLGDVPQAYH